MHDQTTHTLTAAQAATTALARRINAAADNIATLTESAADDLAAANLRLAVAAGTLKAVLARTRTEAVDLLADLDAFCGDFSASLDPQPADVPTVVDSPWKTVVVPNGLAQQLANHDGWTLTEDATVTRQPDGSVAVADRLATFDFDAEQSRAAHEEMKRPGSPFSHEQMERGETANLVHSLFAPTDADYLADGESFTTPDGRTIDPSHVTTAANPTAEPAPEPVAVPTPTPRRARRKRT